MVQRSFLTMLVFFGSLGAVLLGPGGAYADQENVALETLEECEAWSYDYPGCWYEYTSEYCPYPSVEVQAEATNEPMEEDPRDDSVETVAEYEGYESKDYGYQWEYDDYDSAYEDYLWAQLITDMQAELIEQSVDESVHETVAETGAEPIDESEVEIVEEKATEAAVSTWADDYHYWAEYYDEEYRCYEVTVQPTYETAEENESTIDEVVAETTGVDEAALVTDVADEGADEGEMAAAESSMDWQDECQHDFRFDYSYSYEYGYGYGYEEPTFDRTIEADQVETIQMMDDSDEVTEQVADAMEESNEVTEETAEAIEHGDARHEGYHYYGDCDYYSDYYSDYYDSYYDSYYDDYGDSDNADVASPASSEDASDRLTDTDADTDEVSPIEEPAEVATSDSAPLHQAAVLSLARSLDQMGSALKMLSHQLTDMVTPEVATRASTVTDQH